MHIDIKSYVYSFVREASLQSISSFVGSFACSRALRSPLIDTRKDDS